MPEDDARRFRKQAEECRQQAAKAISPLDKETLLRVAEESIRLAQPARKDAVGVFLGCPTPIAWARLAEDTADLVLF